MASIWSTQRLSPRGVRLLAALSLVAVPAIAQSDALKSGITGRVVIAEALLTATEWPMSEEERGHVRSPSRIRRPSGHGPLAPMTAPAPELLVVLEGTKPQKSGVQGLTFEGMRFAPSSVLVPKPARLKITNNHSAPITLLDAKEKAVVTIPAAGSEFVELDAGAHVLTVKEHRFASVPVRVLDKAQILPVGENGLIDPIPVEGGDYKLAFYHGAKPLWAQTLTIPDTKYVAVDASVSDNQVVTVTVKDGSLQATGPK